MSTPEQNRKLADELMHHFFVSHDIDAGLDLLHDQFVSHNPLVVRDPATASGKQAFGDFFRSPAGQGLLHAATEIRRVVADEENVVVHSRISRPGAPDVAVVDILRVQEGLVIEHWDVVQPVPDTHLNPHGMA